jgi:hygromycin-B 4-O-kinase
VVHSDLIHQNVLVEAGAISAVFDWGCALYGDFLYDLAWFTFFSPWHPELRGIDLRSAALAHYASTGLEVPDFEARLRCYEVHIGLAAQAYNTFTDRWQELERSGRRTLDCAVGARTIL